MHIAESYNNCTKHAYIGMNRPENMRAVAKMGYVVAGGKINSEKDRYFKYGPGKPSGSQGPQHVNPGHSLWCPGKINSKGLCGGTTRVMASTLVTHNAEILGMFVLGQAVKKGCSLVYGTSTTMMDLRYTTSCVGSAELALFSAACKNGSIL